MKRNRVLLFVFLFACLISCSKKHVRVPNDVIPKEEMKSILLDEQLAQAAVGNYQYNDSLKYTMNDFTNYVLQKHGVSREKFISSMKFYSSHPDLLKEIYQQVLDELIEKQGHVANQ